ncbi:glycosyl hydrolase [Nonomuraea sp. NPDC004580]|uniref:glycosyl hydrolase n=1 Tax=Nonomuraea sp. NPDC004580 TaxID=3154552 RepID=UPI0033B3240F
MLLVQAARVEPAHSTRDETGLDPASVRTVPVDGGTIIWTAPGDGEWLLISYWQRGSGQRPESGPHTAPEAYVVDHFSRAGTEAVIDFWERRLLTPAIRRLLKRSGGALFEDSIEIESDALPWTPELPAEFERRRGYPLTDVLPVVVLADEDLVFAFDPVLTRHARKDYWDTVSELFNEHHFTALRDWAHSLGLRLRAQPYGLRTDAIEAAAILDVPEGESLGFKNLDDYRCLAGGRDMAGGEVLSCEAGAYQGGAYTTTWRKLLLTMGGAYAAGLNQTVLHGFSYASAPGAGWPGFAAFTPYGGSVGYAESWGPRQPTWARYATPSTLLTMRRVAGRVDYYYLCNGKHQENAKPPVTPIDHEVTLARTDTDGVPYLLDPWTGRAERIARYTEDADGIRLRVALRPGQARIVAIGRPGLFGDRTGTRPHATETSADSVRYDHGHLLIRTTTAGRHTTTLSTGRTVTTHIDRIPQPVEPRTWHLEVRDRRPDGDHTLTLDLDRLAPWHDLPGLADVSGVGTYTTTVDLDGPAYLELGEVTDTCRVRVNGHPLDPVDLLHPVIDLGPHVKRGRNTIEVEVATPLGNRLRQTDPAVYGSLTAQPYGLLGPVRLVPYGEGQI